MDFRVTVLGSGGALPTAMRYCSAQVVNLDGFRMLIDCGEGTQNQIRRNRIKMQTLGTILISHLHGDHFFGLPGLLSSMHLCGRTEPVHLYAPEGLNEILEKIFMVSGTELSYEIIYHQLYEGESRLIIENKKCKVTTFPLVHSVPTFGFLIEEQPLPLNLKKNVRSLFNLAPDEICKIKQGEDYQMEDGTIIPNAALTLKSKKPRKYAYCCDTAYSETLISFVEGADLLCFDCTFDAQMAELALERQHGTSVQAAMLAQKAHVQQLMLTHFSARFHEVNMLVDEAKVLFPNTFAAFDGGRFEVPFNLG